jgi:F-type H+-transporting ATPase subunit b
MLIDWFTVGAQIVNFLILLALLKIFLFDRITHAMDEREKKISARFEDADRKTQEAQQKAQSLDDEKRELEEKREHLLSEAEGEAESERKQRLEQVRREVDELGNQWKEALAEQKSTFGRDLQRLAAQQVYVVSRRVLKDLADEALEERIIGAFIGRVAEMDRDAKNKFSRSLSKKNPSALVRSSFKISTPMRQKITRALRREIAEALEIDYETEPDMLAGIELKTDGKKINWSVSDYLQTLEENVMEALREQTHKDTAQHARQAQDNGEEDRKNNEGRSG